MNSIVTAFLLLLLTFGTSVAQSISLTDVNTNVVCQGRLLEVTYQAVGTFNAGNRFVTQVSDANGSFAQFSIGGYDSTGSGVIHTLIPALGTSYHVRIASTDPYLISASYGGNIQVVANPTVRLAMTRTGRRRTTPISLVGRDVIIVDQTWKKGETLNWMVPQNATSKVITDSSVSVSFPDSGAKKISIIATNSTGCQTQGSLVIRIYSCTIPIPKWARIITSKDDREQLETVWVKAGGEYTSFSDDTVFVEPGGVVDAVGESSVYYVRNGGVLQLSHTEEPNVFIIGNEVSLSQEDFDDYSDSLRCPDLAFDYSQVTASVDSGMQSSSLSIIVSGDELRVHEGSGICTLHIYDILGRELETTMVGDSHPFSLTALTKGTYIVSVTRGIVRKSVVVHR